MPTNSAPNSIPNPNCSLAWSSKFSSRRTIAASPPCSAIAPTCVTASVCVTSPISPRSRRQADACCASVAHVVSSTPPSAVICGSAAAWRLAAFDSTGLDCGHRSFYYVRRRSATSKRWQRVAYSRYAKLELVVDTANHLVLTSWPGRGPRPDTDRFVPLLKETVRQVRLAAALADAGYDSEANHQYARDVQGVRSIHPCDDRASDGEVAHRALPSADEATFEQALWQLWPTVAGRMHEFPDQALSDQHRRGPELLGAMPGITADRVDLPMHADVGSVRGPGATWSGG